MLDQGKGYFYFFVAPKMILGYYCLIVYVNIFQKLKG
jgi:hypothetical protein